jgi:hypothetical protein
MVRKKRRVLASPGDVSTWTLSSLAMIATFGDNCTLKVLLIDAAVPVPDAGKVSSQPVQTGNILPLLPRKYIVVPDAGGAAMTFPGMTKAGAAMSMVRRNVALKRVVHLGARLIQSSDMRDIHYHGALTPSIPMGVTGELTGYHN